MFTKGHHRRIAVLVFQSLVTALAVLAAFQLDRWLEDRRLRTTQAQLVEELAITFDELQEAESRLHPLGEGLRRRLLATSRHDEAFRQPLLVRHYFTSSTTIDIALGNPAVPHLDPEWTRRVSTIYDSIRIYNTLSMEVFDAYIALAADELGRDMFDAKEDYRPIYGDVLKATILNRILQDNINLLLAHVKLIEIGRVRAAVAFRESVDLGKWGKTRVVLSEKQRMYLRLDPASAYCVRVSAREGDDVVDPVLYLFRLIGAGRSAEGRLVDMANDIEEVAYDDDGGGGRDAMWCGPVDTEATYYLLMEEFRGRRGILNVTVDATFRECDVCPEMVVLPGGGVALGRYEITVGEYRAFAVATGAGGHDCRNGYGDSWENPGFPQTERDPVTCVSVNDAIEYVSWLRRRTGAMYRLPTEAEWERGAAGSEVGCHFGGTERPGTCPVGSYGGNVAGLADMVGNVSEWISDCWDGDCDYGVMRGGAWHHDSKRLDTWVRNKSRANDRGNGGGFRVARSMDDDPRGEGGEDEAATERGRERGNPG